ncbi:MAG: DUF1257 domain-containing protein [Thermoproteota archaeon]
MSEIGMYRSQLRFPLKFTLEMGGGAVDLEKFLSFQILKEAMEMVAEKHKGELVRSIKDYYGRETKCDLAVSIPDFGRGIGIQVDRESGAIDFVYDPYGGYEKVAQEIIDEVTQNYIGIAVIRAMKSLGYSVREEPTTREKAVVLLGVKS